MKRLIFGLLLLAGSAGVLQAQQPIIFLVRHAEKAAGPAVDPKDPDLSDLGQARAKALAAVLRESGITAIYATEFKRTQQTAEPLARALKISTTIVSAQELSALLSKLRANTGSALVVGHSNTLPEIIKDFGVTEPVTIAEADYDNLFMLACGSAPRLVRLHLPSTSLEADSPKTEPATPRD